MNLIKDIQAGRMLSDDILIEHFAEEVQVQYRKDPDNLKAIKNIININRNTCKIDCRILKAMWLSIDAYVENES